MMIWGKKLGFRSQQDFEDGFGSGMMRLCGILFMFLGIFFVIAGVAHAF
jgi:hypothetical protein